MTTILQLLLGKLILLNKFIEVLWVHPIDRQYILSGLESIQCVILIQISPHLDQLIIRSITLHHITSTIGILLLVIIGCGWFFSNSRSLILIAILVASLVVSLRIWEYYHCQYIQGAGIVE
jgi:hypothetical protein